jgi:hypothetical protein
MMYAEE